MDDDDVLAFLERQNLNDGKFFNEIRDLMGPDDQPRTIALGMLHVLKMRREAELEDQE